MKTNPSARRRLSVLAVVLAACALVASACGDDSASSSPASDAPQTTAEAALPTKITIGYQNVPNGDLVVKHDQLLEKAFGDGVTIEWKLFDSGGSVNEAVLAGGVDIGPVGSSPASRGISAGIEYQVPWIFDVIGDAEALVVKSDRGITSVSDLAGKTIATPFASTSHYSLLAALDDAGLDDTSVHVIDSEPDDIYAAWQQGDIDGAYVWNPNLAKLTADGGTVLVTSADLAKEGKTTYDLAIVTNSFAKKYPAAVQTWIDQENAAVEKIKSDPDGAAEAVAAELNITPEEAKEQLSQLIFLDAAEQAGPDYLGGGLATNLFAAAQFNLELGKIDSVQPEDAYQRAVATSFAGRGRVIASAVAEGLQICGVEHRYDGPGGAVHALARLDLDIDAGERLCVVGPSGCGKSTLLELLAGLRQPTSGWIALGGRRVVGPSRRRGMVFQQSSSLYPWRTVRGNVELGLELQHVPRRERHERAERELVRVRLTEFADRRVYELSGGMQQRCQIARALAAEPEVLLLDEPFGALDALTRETLQGELRDIWLATQRTVVFVTHSIEEAVLLGSRVVVMSARPGRVLVDRALPFSRSGRTLQELRSDPEFVSVTATLRKAIDAPDGKG